MGRRPCCSKEGLNRGAWTAMEDQILTSYVKAHGEGNWRDLPKRAGLKRCGKSCRLRWLNYLRPDIKRGNISKDEEELIVRLHRLLGNRWALIAGRLPGRTDNEIKNYWNTVLAKKARPVAESSKRKHFSDEPLRPLLLPPANGVIRTKAIKCTRTVIPTLNFPPSGYKTMELQIQAEHHHHHKSSFLNSLHPKSDHHTMIDHNMIFSDFFATDGQFDHASNYNTINGAEQGRDMSSLFNIGPAEYCDPLEGPMLMDWSIRNSCIEDDDRNFDLESLAFFLDSDKL